MRIIYQTNEVIIINTENENIINPIYVFLNKKVLTANYFVVYGCDSDFKLQIEKIIVRDGFENYFYANMVDDLLKLEEKLEKVQLDKIEMIEKNLNKIAKLITKYLINFDYYNKEKAIEFRDYILFKLEELKCKYFQD